MASATVASNPTAAISRSQRSSTLINPPSALRPGAEFHWLKTRLTHYDHGDAEVKKICERGPTRSSAAPRFAVFEAWEPRGLAPCAPRPGKTSRFNHPTYPPVEHRDRWGSQL